MEINVDEVVKNPATAIAQVFFLMNMWAQSDMDRMSGDLNFEEQSLAFSGILRPIAQAWSEALYNLPEDLLSEVIDIEQDLRKDVREDIFGTDF